MKYFTLLLLVAITALAGCASSQTPEPMPLLTAPAYEDVNPGTNPGSLFDANRSEFLYEDNRARRVGDIVLVNVEETSKTKLTAETTANRESSSTMGITAMPSTGLMGNIPLAGAVGAEIGTSLDTGSSSELSSDGETTSESEFTATVATRIVRRLPGGILQVEGARRLRVNNETQFLIVRGLIRQRDIGSTNSIDSSMLAEAQIEIYGQGVVSDKQRAGWMSRILDNISPF